MGAQAPYIIHHAWKKGLPTNGGIFMEGYVGSWLASEEKGVFPIEATVDGMPTRTIHGMESAVWLRTGWSLRTAGSIYVQRSYL